MATITLTSLEGKSLNKPDQTMSFPKGHADVVTLGGISVVRLVLEPGWKWSTHMKPTVGTPSCQKRHFQYLVSGRLGARMDNGTHAEYGPGDVMLIPAGHDGYTIGSEPAIVIDFGDVLPT